MQSNAQLQLAHDFVEYTSTNIFLTGRAGTGKTTFLKNIRKSSSKRLIVLAPTGVAAINAMGETLHSFFQLPFSPYIEGVKNNQVRRFNKTKIAIIRSLDLLVIDEISMVRSDLLDAVDDVLRRFRDRTKPFGGVQLLMIGDLQQLSPVVKPDEWEMLSKHYDSPYFFDSKMLKLTSYACVELKHIFRQKDIEFIELLEKVRTANLDRASIEMLNSRYIENFKPPRNKNYITLTSHNYAAREINEKKLKAIKQPEYVFDAVTSGVFPESQYPVDASLRLKLGAQVMFTKNDNSPEKRFVNGTIGVIVSIDDDRIEIKPNEGEQSLVVEKMQWENCKYTLDEQTQEISETIEGTFTQYPLRTAWAITIHKSQGLTFDYTMIDASDAFSHGQVYVALSRCRTLGGIVLLSPLSFSAVISDYRIKTYMGEVENNPMDETVLERRKRDYFKQVLCEIYSFDVFERSFNSLHRLVRESVAGSYPKLALRWSEDAPKVKEQIINVGEKFAKQIIFLLKDGDISSVQLKERMTKASGYFIGKLHELLCPLIEASRVSVEAKDVKKQLERLLDTTHEQLQVKLAVMAIKSCDFSTNEYLRCKAKAVLDCEKARDNKAELTTKKLTKKEIEQSDIQNVELFEQLRFWRNSKAKELGVLPFQVATQKVIIGLANYIHQSAKELTNIKGRGAVFVKKYGTEVMAILDEYVAGRR